jgi:hypothetical protein
MIPGALPHDRDAERAVLGAALLSREAFDAARAILSDSHFYVGPHRIIWRAFLSVADAGGPLDLRTVCSELERTHELEAAGGPAYVADLDSACPHSRNAEAYARIVRDRAHRRDAVRIGAEITEAAANGTTDVELSALLGVARDALGAIRLGAGAALLPAEDAADVLPRPTPPVPWAAREAIAEGDVVLVTGPGGIGKSWLVLSASLSLATGRTLWGRFEVTRPYRVAILDLESRPWETDGRLQRLALGEEITAEKLAGRVQLIRCRLQLDDPKSLGRLIASLGEWRTEFLIVDSFRRATTARENTSEDISAVFTQALDPLRVELGCGIILTDHTRKVTGEPDLDAPDQALRGSLDKRNRADAHFGLERRQERLALIPTKTRHSALPAPFLLELTGLEPDAEDNGPVRVEYAGNVDRASDRVQDSIVALLEEAAGSGLLRGEIIGRSGYSERAADGALGALRKRGRIERRKDGKQMRYFLTGSPRPQRPQTTARRIWEPE